MILTVIGLSFEIAFDDVNLRTHLFDEFFDTEQLMLLSDMVISEVFRFSSDSFSPFVPSV